MSHGCDERNCSGAVRVNCATEQVRWRLQDDTAAYELAVDTTQAQCDE